MDLASGSRAMEKQWLSATVNSLLWSVMEENISLQIKDILSFIREIFRTVRYMGMELLISQPQFSIEENFKMEKGMGLESTNMQVELPTEETGKMTIKMDLESGAIKTESYTKANGSIINETDQEFTKRMVIITSSGIKMTKRHFN